MDTTSATLVGSHEKCLAASRKCHGSMSERLYGEDWTCDYGSLGQVNKVFRLHHLETPAVDSPAQIREANGENRSN